ncbi:hypothetical protein V5799_002972 [Amblyomma americanum]|uniref:TIR domain-containing protein n=1 Tax=Amblyomma americanum TaxID=6943 RepID=A0AAQ4DAA7_AMBAM
MAALEGIFFKTLTFLNVSLTELPVKFLKNRTIHELDIFNCPLRDISETAIGSANKVSSIHLKRTMLNSLPSGLSSAKGLLCIIATLNAFKVLHGSLLLPELRKLDLRYNGIEEVSETYLMGMPKLEHLLLSQNKIHHLSAVLFEKTRNLREVHIGKNRITQLNGIFDGMHSLQTLFLRGDMIMDIRKLVSSRMPELKYLNLEENSIDVVPVFASSNRNVKVLVLSRNRITNVDPGAFKALDRMIRVDLHRNNISYLDETLFATGSRLETINLAQNMLHSVIGTFKNTRLLRKLNLSSNRITSITDCFSGLRSLMELSLRDNLISHVVDYTFKENTGLLEIDLSRNNIQWVGRDAFKGLVTLLKLLLQRNQFLSLNASLRNLPSLQHFDATLNSIENFQNGEFGKNGYLNSILLSWNNISSVEGAFTGAVRLRTLKISGNRIVLLRRSDFPPHMVVTPNIVLHNNPLMCDCNLAWLVRRDSAVRLVWTARCEQPPWRKGNALLKLSEKDLATQPQDCPAVCRCECRQGHARGIVVNCSSKALTKLPNVLPEGTTELDLSDNHLEQLDHTLRRSVPQLQVLSVKNNWLSSLNISVLPDMVETLDVRANRLTKLPHALVEERNLTSLWLSGNPYDCDCADYPFRQWIEGNPRVVRDAGGITCAESPNTLVSRKDFAGLGQKQLCPAAFPEYAKYLLYVMGVLLVFLTSSAAYFNFERQLKAWLHARGVCGWLQCVAEEEVDAEKLFDVFLSFSNKDARWVDEQLLSRLEGFGFSCCTYERNFKGGFLLQDIIRDAVACSRWSLLVITQNFVASEWCRWEFRLAHQRALQDNINRLLVVLVDDVASGALDEDLRLYVQAANHLRWGEPNFWERLRRSLLKKDAKRKLIIEQPNSSI